MYWAGREPPAPQVGLRTGSSRRVPSWSTTTTARLVGTVDARPRLPRRPPGRALPAPGPPVPGRASSTSTTTGRVLEPADDADEHTQTRESTDIAIVTASERVGAGRRAARPTSARSTVTNHDRRVPAQADVDQRASSRSCRPRPPAADAHDQRACWYTVPLDDARRRRHRAGPGARHRARGRARAHRAAAALRDLRPLGRRRRVDGVAPADRRADDLRVRRLPGRRRHRRARVRRTSRAHVRAAARARRRAARATTAARRACSHRSAATGTSTSTSTLRSPLLEVLGATASRSSTSASPRSSR